MARNSPSTAVSGTLEQVAKPSLLPAGLVPVHLGGASLPLLCMKKGDVGAGKAEAGEQAGMGVLEQRADECG